MSRQAKASTAGQMLMTRKPERDADDLTALAWGDMSTPMQEHLDHAHSTTVSDDM